MPPKGSTAVARQQSQPQQQGLAKLTPQQSLIEVVKSKEEAIRQVCGKHLSATKLVKLAVVMISKMPDLALVPPLQVVQELMVCARLGIEPHCEGGRWFVVFKNKKGGHDLTGINDYRALIDIARRSGHVRAVHADVIREGDLWEYRVDTTSDILLHLRHEPRRGGGKPGALVGAYAVVRLKNGQAQGCWLDMDEIAAARARSKAGESEYGPWSNDFPAMAKKTAVRRLYNLLPKSPEIRRAQEVEAEDEERSRLAGAVDITEDQPSRRGMAGVKERLAAKLGRGAQGAPPPQESPPPEDDQGEVEPGPGTATDVAGLDAEAEAEERQREPGEEG